MISNPEFLKEGSAIKDFMQPDRVVIGSENENSTNTLKALYRPFTINRERFIQMDINMMGCLKILNFTDMVF